MNNNVETHVDIPESSEDTPEQRSGCCRKRADYSLYLFSPTNKLRQLLQRIVTTKTFDYIILFFIAFNCITLAMERPSISPTSIERQFLKYTNYMFTTIFTIEMLMKVIANGLVIGRQTYLRNGWNVMDGFLVVVSLVDLIIMSRSSVGEVSNDSDAASHILGMLRVLRLLRALRPLRGVYRSMMRL